MSGLPLRRTSLSRYWAAGLLCLSILTLASADAAPIVLPSPKADASPVAAAKYDLESLRAFALAHNTSIAAARASLAAAISGQQGVDNIHIPTCLQPDLPIRRKQAALGVQAAEAGVRLAELHTVFGVQFAYVSYLYAQEQDRLASRATERLDKLTKSVKEVRRSPDVKTDLRESDEVLLESIQHFAAAKLTETRSGSKRALSALREALGIGCDVPLSFTHGRLIAVKPALDQKHLVELALANRPELLQASINVQVSELEVQAQKSRRGLNVRTFASGADLHANPLPVGRYDVEYRPGAIGPEMPPFLGGKQSDRVARASAYLSRAGSVLERSRGLIALEVEQAYLRYEENTAKFESLYKGAAMLRSASDRLLVRLGNSGFGEGSVPILDELMKHTQVLSSMRVQANEARYQQLLALITLERATGAAFRADLSGAPEMNDD